METVPTSSRQTPVLGRETKVSECEVDAPNAHIAGVKAAQEASSDLQPQETNESQIVAESLPTRQRHEYEVLSTPFNWISMTGSGPFGRGVITGAPQKYERCLQIGTQIHEPKQLDHFPTQLKCHETTSGTEVSPLQFRGIEVGWESRYPGEGPSWARDVPAAWWRENWFLHRHGRGQGSRE